MTLVGGQQSEIQCKVDQEKVKLHKLSLNQVVEAINRSGLDLPSGKVQTAKESNSVRLTGKFQTTEDIRNVQISMPVPGSPVYVRDVAAVIDGIREVSSVNLYNSKNGIGLLLKKQGDANAVDVSRLVRERFTLIEEQNKDAAVKFIIDDDSTDTNIAAVDSVLFTLFIAIIDRKS